MNLACLWLGVLLPPADGICEADANSMQWEQWWWPRPVLVSLVWFPCTLAEGTSTRVVRVYILLRVTHRVRVDLVSVKPTVLDSGVVPVAGVV